MERKLICIGCPLGCELTAQVEGGEVRSVTGNTCPNGERYARKELTNPTRILTTTVRVKNGALPVVSVKTRGEVPKGKLLDCARALKAIEVAAPVALSGTGDRPRSFGHRGGPGCHQIRGTGIEKRTR